MRIQAAFVDQYRKLLGSDNRSEEGFERLLLPLLSKLGEEVKVGLEVPMRISEVEAAIKELTPGKSPGPDGLSAEFYQFFKRELAEALHSVLSESYKLKMLPPSFTSSHGQAAESN